MNRVKLLAVLTMFIVWSAAAYAATADRSTPAEAKAMLQKAVEHFKSAGRERALSDFTAGKPPFRDRDLYVVCVASDHTIVANGAFPAFVGTSADALNANGKPLGKALWDAAAKDSGGSIQYAMRNPATGNTETKTTFFSKVAADLLCGVGVYGQ
jgi:hypothetical protein